MRSCLQVFAIGKVLLTILLLIQIFGCTRQSQGDFEGVIVMKMTMSEGNGTTESKYSIGNGGTRIDITANLPNLPGNQSFHSATLLKSNQPNLRYELDLNNKTYTELPNNFNSQAANSFGDQKFTVKKVGSEKLLGYNCDHILLNSDNNNIEMECWLSKEVFSPQFYKKFEQTFGGGNPAMKQTLQNANVDGFPLKVVMHANYGGKKNDVTVEAVQIEKQSIPESQFEIPADFRKLTTPNLPIK